MRLAFGKGLYFLPFGAVLVCEWFFASRLGIELERVVTSLVSPVVVLTDARRSYDPFAFVYAQGAGEPFPAPSADESSWVADEVQLEGTSELLASGNAKTGARLGGVKGRSLAGALPSIRVSAETVIRIAQAGRTPNGKPVAASGRRPSGIQVFGVAALGIGVRDGDVLTDVSGVPVTAVGQVVALIVAARGARQPAIQGRLWRGQRNYLIVVEQPYVTPTDPKGGQVLVQAAALSRSEERQSEGTAAPD